MELSKALPVKFWPEGTDTFNEKENSGVDSHCYFHPWQCNDPIEIQGIETTSVKDLRVIVLDENLNTLATIPMNYVENSDGTFTFYCSFTPTSIGACNKLIKLQIVDCVNGIEGESTDHLETAVGDLFFTADVFDIDGSPDDYIETSSATVVNSLEGSFKLGEVSEGAMCAATPEVLYYEGPAPWGTGKFMFMDKELTSPVLGYLFITDDSGTGYNMDGATGEVLTVTGNVC